jgi:EcsC family protein
MPNELTFSDNPIIRQGIAQENALLDRLFTVLFKVVQEIPSSSEQRSGNAVFRARKLVAETALKAAAISGALALPSGPLGWLTILPDLAAIWQLQAQLVADIGAVFGKRGKLTEASIIYCLFRHAAAQAVRDLVTRMGERVVVQRISIRATETVLQTIGVRLVYRIARRGLWRWVPAIGALAVAGYAYYDTERVGQTAIEFFSKDIELS